MLSWWPCTFGWQASLRSRASTNQHFTDVWQGLCMVQAVEAAGYLICLGEGASSAGRCASSSLPLKPATREEQAPAGS